MFGYDKFGAVLTNWIGLSAANSFDAITDTEFWALLNLRLF